MTVTIDLPGEPVPALRLTSASTSGTWIRVNGARWVDGVRR